MNTRTLILATAIASLGGIASAEGISTHVLNIATGEGGGGIPITLDIRDGDGWQQIGKAQTEENGRVESFDVETKAAEYRLHFDMAEYTEFGDAAFFPEIEVIFSVSDPERAHHLPVLVSPFGYSTYLGN